MRLALGTVQFGIPYGIANQSGQVSRSAAAEILSLAQCHGIDTLDTAIAYGESEDSLGKLGVGSFKIITKLSAIPKQCTDIKGWMYDEVAGSLSRLGRRSIYGLLLHRSGELAGEHGKTLVDAFENLKKDGLVQKIGVSIYSPAELDAVMQACEIDLIQAPFNVIDRRLFTSGWMRKLKGMGIEIHTRSAFLQGLLLMKKEAIPKKFEAWNLLWNRWHDWLSTNAVIAPVASLAYPLSFPEIDRVVIGVDSVEQLKQLIEAASTPFLLDWPDLSSNDEMLINPSNWNVM